MNIWKKEKNHQQTLKNVEKLKLFPFQEHKLLIFFLFIFFTPLRLLHKSHNLSFWMCLRFSFLFVFTLTVFILDCEMWIVCVKFEREENVLFMRTKQQKQEHKLHFTYKFESNWNWKSSKICSKWIARNSIFF